MLMNGKIEEGATREIQRRRQKYFWLTDKCIAATENFLTRKKKIILQGFKIHFCELYSTVNNAKGSK